MLRPRSSIWRQTLGRAFRRAAKPVTGLRRGSAGPHRRWLRPRPRRRAARDQFGLGRAGRHQVAGPDPGGEQGLVGVAEGGVRDGHRYLTQRLAKPSGPSSRSRWRTGHEPGTVEGRQLVRRIRVDGEFAIGLVDCDVGQPGQELGAAVGGDPCPGCSGRSSMNEVATLPAMKSASSSTACRKEMLVDTPRMRNSARDGGRGRPPSG